MLWILLGGYYKSMSDVNGKNSVCLARWQHATVLSNKHARCGAVRACHDPRWKTNEGSARLMWGCARRQFLSDPCHFKDRQSRNPNVIGNHLLESSKSLSAHEWRNYLPGNNILCKEIVGFMNFQLTVIVKLKSSVEVSLAGNSTLTKRIKNISPESAKVPNIAFIKHSETTRGC